MVENQISIRVEQELVTFTKGCKSLSFTPIIHLDASSTVCSIGEAPADISDSIRVDLFQDCQSCIDLSDALAAFLRHGITSLLSERLFQLRPSIAFAISPEVAAFLQHYHKAIFRDAANQAGAIPSSVTFISSPIV